MIPVVRLAPGNQFDQTLLDDLIGGRLWPHGIEFERLDAYPRAADGICLVVPGRYWADHAEQISHAISKYRWVLAFRVGDEEDLFEISAVQHPAIKWWVQTPRAGKDYGDARFLPLGYTPHFRDLPAQPPGKPQDAVLIGQCTHQRRGEAFDALARVGRPKYVQSTNGFTQGLPPAEYAHLMLSAKVAPCPAGPASPDTFRAWEALAAHAIPILDDLTPGYDSRGYWERMLPGCPTPILTDYDDLPGYIDDVLKAWPANANRIAAYWIARKRKMVRWLREDLKALGANHSEIPKGSTPITVVVSTSPIPSHPSTAIIDETIASVRAQLPDSEIILMCDGVRPEQEDRRGDYEEYLRRLLWKADHEWGNTLPLVFDKHLHQAGCTKRALERVRTPLLLFVEADTPLTDGEIPWDGISSAILAGDANVIRLHHEAGILEPHRHLMLTERPETIWGAPMMRTIQWSQRPHLASVAWYRELLDRWFPNDERNFIEDVVYGRLIAAYERDSDMGWLGWRTWIYTPEGDIKRSYHTDGRAGESKFDG